MSLSKFNKEVNNHQSLPDKPTLTADELKAIWDKAVSDIKEYINNTLTTEIDTELGKKANNSSVYSKTDADILLESKANSADVKLKGDFAQIAGNCSVTVSGGQSKSFYFDCPSGFSSSNSRIICFEASGRINEPGWTAYITNNNKVCATYTNNTSASVGFIAGCRITLLKVS